MAAIDSEPESEPAESSGPGPQGSISNLLSGSYSDYI